jgi:outer membrane protein OmpA-like peptidoglycan-associated protein
MAATYVRHRPFVAGKGESRSPAAMRNQDVGCDVCGRRHSRRYAVSPVSLAERAAKPHTLPAPGGAGMVIRGDRVMVGLQRVVSATVLTAALALSATAYAQAPAGAPATTQAPAVAAPAKAEPRILIYFNEFSAYLTPRAKAIIAKAAKDAKATDAKAITVQARASATGTVQTNKYLAMTRASIVADELEADGIEPGMIQQQPIGQTGSSDPSVFNRRVDIIIEH